MSYDHDLAHRIRELLSGAQFTERAMFGGLAFLIGGNMAVCVSGRGGLMVRVPAQDTAALLDRSHVEPMVMGGREVRGWIRVTDQGIGIPANDVPRISSEQGSAARPANAADSTSGP